METPQLSSLLGLLLVMVVWNVPNQCHAIQQQPKQALAVFQKEIKKRVARDQAARIAYLKQTAKLEKKGESPKDDKRLIRLVERAVDVDKKNIAWLKEQIKRFGYPRVSEIGSDTADGFFLLIIHADRDRAFQKRCIEQMKEMPDEWPESYVEKLMLRRKMTASMNLKQISPPATEKPAEKKPAKDQATPQAMPSDDQLPPPAKKALVPADVEED